MNTGIIAMRYAKAMLEYTEKESVSDKVFGEMESLARKFALEPRLRAYLMNPMLAAEDKMALLESAVGGKPGRQMQRFLTLVLLNRREEFLQQIALNYLDLYRKARHIRLATIETAVPVPVQTQERIRQYLAGKTDDTIQLDLHLNPALIGGFIFRMDFREIDASVAGQLRDIKRQFKRDIGRTI